MRKHKRQVTFKVEYYMAWGWYARFRELYRRFKTGDDSVLDELGQYLNLDEEGTEAEVTAEKTE